MVTHGAYCNNKLRKGKHDLGQNVAPYGGEVEYILFLKENTTVKVWKTNN